MGKKEDESLENVGNSEKKFLPDKEEEEEEEEEEPSGFNYEVQKGSRISEVFDTASTFLKLCWKKTLGQIDGDWVFLTLLGVFMSFISLFVEATINVCTMSRFYLFRDMITEPILRYFGWVCIPCCLILFSTAFTKLFAPQVAGSGIPELKTTMGGIIMKDSFTFRALVTKIIALTTTLGTGLPIGREGPFVHISSQLAVVLTKFTSNIKGEYVNRSRNIDVLSAGCAVGVASAFSAPVGGVLFSIEVTSFHFAVRNYWRGFYAALCGTIVHRFLAVWYKGDASLIAMFKTDITTETPFALQELFGFVLLGMISGVLGALFVWTHRQYVVFKNTNRIMKAINDKSVLLYPFLVTLVYTTLTFPLGTGMFMAGQLTIDEQVSDAFRNFSWQKPNPSIHEFTVIEHWRSPYNGVYVSLVTYLVFAFFGSIAAISLPVPAGVFIPLFKFGAVLGRLFGELMVTIFPDGFSEGVIDTMIIPGAYSIVGAAAFAGAATHTVSTAVIAFELTGQIVFAIPIMVGVIIANAIAQVLQPSIFDSIIRMRKLPYLPAIPTTSSRAYDVFVEDFMDRNLKIIWYGITYEELKVILLLNKKLTDFPLVDSPENMILLGSANRYDLIDLLKENVNEKKKLPYFNEWKLIAEKQLLQELPLPLPEKTVDTPKAVDIVNEKEVKGSEEEKQKPEEPQEKFSDKPPNQIPVTKAPFIRKSMSGSLDTLRKIDHPLTIPTIDIQYIDTVSLDGRETDIQPEPSSERRPSRFSVTKVGYPSDSSPAPEGEGTEEGGVEGQDAKKDAEKKDDPSSAEPAGFQSPAAFHQSIAKTHDSVEHEGPQLPKKSILKKTQSFIFEPHRHELIAPHDLDEKRNYVTIHGDSAQFKGMKQSLSVFLKAKSLMRMDSRSSPITFTGFSRADIPAERLVEMIRKMEISWEEEQMKKKVEFSKCQLNPAPHQLVERTNLLQVHSMFSLLGLNHSYVTAIGRLIGVVGLNDLRIVIEKMNAGELKYSVEKPANRRFSFGFRSFR